MFGESFDLTLAFAAGPDGIELVAAAGTTDPIRITLPAPDARRMLGAQTLSVAALAARYQLNPTQTAIVEEVRKAVEALADEVGAQGALVFEIADFGLRVPADGEPKVSGDIRIVELPRVLESLRVLSNLTVSLGSSHEDIYIALGFGSPPDDYLARIPLPTDHNGPNHVDIFLQRLKFAYVWARDEFAVGLETEIQPARPLELTHEGTGVIVPGVRFAGDGGMTATVPPIPLFEADLTFPPPQGDTSVVANLGLQAVIGDKQSRFVTAYLRKAMVSPSVFLLTPGIGYDAGLIVGGPHPKDFSSLPKYLDVGQWERDAFFARFTVTDGLLVFIDPPIGLLLNPLAAGIPPFITANPPYWIAPPQRMGDLYGHFGASFNVPGLAYVNLDFDKPQPEFSLDLLLELAAFIAGGFQQPLAADGALANLFYVSLGAEIDLDIAGLKATLGPQRWTVNVASVIDAAMMVKRGVTGALDGAEDLVAQLRQDSSALVRMVPLKYRWFAGSLGGDVAGFSVSGSAFLLTAEELHQAAAVLRGPAAQTARARRERDAASALRSRGPHQGCAHRAGRG